MKDKSFPDNGERQNVVIAKHKVIFMCVGKCASSALRDIAVRTLRIPAFNLQFINNFKVTTAEIAKRPDLRKMDRVAIIRDPKTRLLSVWGHKVQRSTYRGYRILPGFYRKMSFPDFARLVASIDDNHPLVDGHFRSQHCFLFHKGEYLPTHTIRFEGLNLDVWQDLLDTYKLPVTAQQVSTKHKSKVVFYDAVYDKKTTLIVKERYKKDHELFRYN